MYDVVLVAPNGDVFCTLRTPDPTVARRAATSKNNALRDVPWLHYEVHEEAPAHPQERLFSD